MVTEERSGDKVVAVKKNNYIKKLPSQKNCRQAKHNKRGKHPGF
jgi:hypothetical protein